MAAKVTKDDRKNHSATKDGRFPVNSKSEAKSALELRGHNTTKAKRRAIINACMKYMPKEAKAAMEEDRKKGLV